MTDNIIHAPGIKLSGHFEAQVYNVYTDTWSDKIVSTNRILNGFFNTWFAGTAASYTYFSHCALDGSATPVTATDTSITQVGPARAAYDQEEPIVFTAPNQHRTGKQYVFAMAVAPATVNSLAIFNAASGGLLVARANLASPLNLVVGDILTVKHYVTATLDLADRTGILSLGSPAVDYPYTMRWINPEGPFESSSWHASPWNLNTSGFSNIAAPNFGYTRFSALQTQVLPANPQNYNSSFSSMAGDVFMFSGQNPPSVSALPYTTNNFYRDVEFTFPYNIGNTPLTIGNLCFVCQNAVSQQAGFVINFPTLRLPKDNTKEFKITLRFAWGV